MKHLLLTLVLVLMGSQISAQFSRETLAVEMMDRWRYADAYPLWADLAQESLVSDSTRWDWIRLASESSFQADFTDEALRWNDTLVANGMANVEDWLRQFELLRLTNHYERLPESITAARDQFTADSLLSTWELEIPMILSMFRDSVAYRVERLRPLAESEEFSAFPFKEGLVYMSTGLNGGFLPQRDGWTGQYYTELSMIDDESNPYQEYTWFEQIRNRDLFMELGRTTLHDGPVAFDSDEDFAVVTRNHVELDTTERAVRSRLQIQFYLEREGAWQRADSFAWNDRHYSVAHGTFDLNDDLIFASDMPGGFGGMDLYRSVWKDGGWSQPENYGPVVNTAGNEVFPFVSKTGALFFSSNGHAGIGGLDIYVYRDGANQHEHLGIPINSHADDFSFVFDEKSGKGWLSSNRSDSQDAIYEIEGAPSAGSLLIEVRACDGSPMANTEVKIQETNWGSVLRATTNAEGRASFDVMRSRDYEVTCDALPGMEAPPVIRVEMPDSASYAATLDLNFVMQINQLVVQSLEGIPLANALLSFENREGKRLNRVTNENGLFEWNDEIGLEFWRVHVSLINYWDGYQEFEAPPSGCAMSIQKTIQLRPITKQDERIALENIYYDLDKYNLRAKGKRELDKVVAYMDSHPAIRIELSSHTDCRNSSGYNETLSQNRAQSCVDYIVSKGISPGRIVAMGYGERVLVNQCSDENACECNEYRSGCQNCDEAFHQANRRTELKLLGDQ